MKKFYIYVLQLLLICFSTVTASYTNAAEDEKEFKYDYSSIDTGCEDIYDPYEKINRKVFMVNGFLDYIILRPIAIGYRDLTNDYTKARVGSFLENINYPLTTVNFGFQARANKTISSFWRIVINTTLGVGGLFDVASKFGIGSEPQTFGSTLASYGVGPGPYIILPIFGSTNARDAADLIAMNNGLNPVRYYLHKDFKLALTGAKIVHDRMSILPFTDYVTKNSADPYTAIKTAHQEGRQKRVQYPKDFDCPKVNKK